MKRLLMLVFVILLFLSFNACSSTTFHIADNIHPPKPSGELYDIQLALEKSVGQSINLCYPSSGEYRSAIITNDIDNDQKIEAFAFYSTETDDKTTIMHINYINWDGEKWVSVSDLQVDCAGVESVSFENLDQSAVPKILVNWSRYSASDNQLSVYSIDFGVLQEVTKANCSVYTACDLDDDGISELIAVYYNSATKSSTATLLSLSEGGFTEKSVCTLDGNVTKYHEPVVSQFTDGQNAVFIDAEKATGLITEILYLKEGKLLSAFSLNAEGEHTVTLRASAVRSDDYNKDGCVDIPLAKKIPMAGENSDTESAYMTVWHSFDGRALTPIAYTVINFTDGYYLNLPENLVESFAVERVTDIYQRIFYRWDNTTHELGEEILRIQKIPLKTFTSDKFENYIELMRTLENVYVVKLSNSALTPNIEYLKQNFHLINSTIISGE